MGKVTIVNKSSVTFEVKARKHGVLKSSSTIAPGGRDTLSVGDFSYTLAILQGSSPVHLVEGTYLNSYKEITLYGSSTDDFDYSGTKSRWCQPRVLRNKHLMESTYCSLGKTNALKMIFLFACTFHLAIQLHVYSCIFLLVLIGSFIVL